MAAKLWVQFKPYNAAKVSTDGCQNVDDFLKASKKKLLFLYGSIPSSRLSLSTCDGGPPLRPGLLLTDIPSQPGYAENDDEHPLFISVVNAFAMHRPAPTLWRATGFITGARKVRLRRGLYRTAQTNLGFYEKLEGRKRNPFSYQEDGSLMINVLFENKSDALHFRATVYEDVDAASLYNDVSVSLSVEEASDAVMDEMILVGHYDPAEDLPLDSSLMLSEVTEVENTSPLFKYQRLESERHFGSLYKADRTYLIEKSLCEKGKRFANMEDSDNNVLALTKQARCWFDAISNGDEKIPFFKLLIKQVSETQDPDNDDRYRVLLTVEAFNAETGRLFFQRLKEGSVIVDDTHAETFVYVRDPEKFRVCLSWKNTKIDSLWYFTPAVE